MKPVHFWKTYDVYRRQASLQEPSPLKRMFVGIDLRIDALPF